MENETWKEFAKRLSLGLSERNFINQEFSISLGDRAEKPRDRGVYVDYKMNTLFQLGNGYLRFYQKDILTQHLPAILEPALFSYLLDMAKQTEQITLRELIECNVI